LKQEKPDNPVSEFEHSGFVETGNSQECHRAAMRSLRSSDVWMVEKLEPRQFKKLWLGVVDLIDEKKEKEAKTREKYEER
jgi:hypothetical protein